MFTCATAFLQLTSETCVLPWPLYIDAVELLNPSSSRASAHVTPCLPVHLALLRTRLIALEHPSKDLLATYCCCQPVRSRKPSLPFDSSNRVFTRYPHVITGPKPEAQP